MYATLEEAFGVSSFAPAVNVPTGARPLALRGNVGAVAKRNDRRMRTRVGTVQEPTRAKVPKRCDVVKAHARGGAAAAWRVIPHGVRADMVRYIDKSHFHRGKPHVDVAADIDVAAVVAVAVAVLVLIM
jgi:hypothetical protein